MEIKVVNKSENKLPEYKTAGAAGCDIAAWLPNGPVTIKPGHSLLIPTGLYIQLPPGFEAQLRPRSGLALKYGITVLNTPGTIDADYRGEIGVILYNSGEYDFEVCSGDRIAQMVIARCEQANFEVVKELDETDRADGGFGHTGVSENEKMNVDEFLQSAISEEIVQRMLSVEKLREGVRNGKVEDIDREDFKKRIAKIMLIPETESVLEEIAAVVFDYTDEEYKDWQTKMNEKNGHKDNKDNIDKE